MNKHPVFSLWKCVSTVLASLALICVVIVTLNGGIIHAAVPSTYQPVITGCGTPITEAQPGDVGLQDLQGRQRTTLSRGQCLLPRNQATELLMGTGGVLKLFDMSKTSANGGPRLMWSTTGLGADEIVMQNGNLGMYNGNTLIKTIAATNYSNAWLTVQKDGNLIIYTYNNNSPKPYQHDKILWATNTFNALHTPKSKTMLASNNSSTLSNSPTSGTGYCNVYYRIQRQSGTRSFTWYVTFTKNVNMNIPGWNLRLSFNNNQSFTFTQPPVIQPPFNLSFYSWDSGNTALVFASNSSIDAGARVPLSFNATGSTRPNSAMLDGNSCSLIPQ